MNEVHTHGLHQSLSNSDLSAQLQDSDPAQAVHFGAALLLLTEGSLP
jgi:hypothetical protein